MPTAYLSPSQLQDLTNVSSTAPGSGDNGKALVWNQTAGRWQAAQVAYSNLSGAPALPIPVADGGTGTQTGSITGTGALTFAAGGTNQNVNITPSGTGELAVSGQALRIIQPANTTTGLKGINFSKSGNDGFFSVINGTFGPTDFIPYFYAKTTYATSSLNLVGLQSPVGDNVFGVCYFAAYNTAGSGPIAGGNSAFTFQNYATKLIEIFGNGNAHFLSTTDSTLTTNGAVCIAGGVGIAKNLFVGGGRINFANLPTSEPATVGDLWRDGNVIKVKI
jgi:hypothetical protein